MLKFINLILGGEIFLKDLFSKNIVFIILFFLITILFINHQYDASKELATVGKLERELKDAKYEYIGINSQLSRIEMRSEVEKLLKSRGIDLEFSTDSIYIIKK